MNKIRYCLPVILAALLLGGCTAKSREPFRDAPTAGHDNSPAKVIEFPDGFSNQATKCVDGIRYTSAFKGDNNRAAISVLGGDNGCPK